jgi:hypothetical protein
MKKREATGCSIVTAETNDRLLLLLPALFRPYSSCNDRAVAILSLIVQFLSRVPLLAVVFPHVDLTTARAR